MNYFKDFKDERFHDDNLIKLCKLLHKSGRTDVFERFLGLETNALGSFIDGKRRKDFDVELSYDKYVIAVETKVDSAEGYYEEDETHQTYRIANKYNSRWKRPIIFLFITYGTAEFHIYKNQNGEYKAGPYSNHFKHIGCGDMHQLVNDAISTTEIKEKRLLTWRDWLTFELKKRSQRDLYLKDLNSILERYKETLHLTDYPINRLNLFTPEFTMPFYNELCLAWNNLEHSLIGKAVLYPIGRGYSPVSDTILNFHDLWYNDQVRMTCNGIADTGSLYFEFNEDFNLHLKCTPKEKRFEEIRAYAEANTEQLNCGFAGIVEYHKQGAYAIYEWDLKLLSNTLEQNLTSIETVISNALRVLR